jgi:hypothetical protein
MPQRIGVAVGVHLDGMVDHHFSGCQGIHAFRVAAKPGNCLAHRREVHDAGNAGKVLHDDAGGRERNFVSGRGFWVPVEQCLDVAARDVDPVLEAEKVFQEDFQREGQAGKILALERGQAVDVIRARAYLQ